MGKPMPDNWYDSFVDIAWWAGAMAGAAFAGAPFIFYIVSCDMKAKATAGLYKKRGFRQKPALVSPEICVAKPKEQNAMYERGPDVSVEMIADSNLIPDLARLMGACEIHEKCLGSIVSESAGPSNYRQRDRDAA